MGFEEHIVLKGKKNVSPFADDVALFSTNPRFLIYQILLKNLVWFQVCPLILKSQIPGLYFTSKEKEALIKTTGILVNRMR